MRRRCCCGGEECIKQCLLHPADFITHFESVYCSICTNKEATLTFDGEVFSGTVFDLGPPDVSNNRLSQCVELDGFWWQASWNLSAGFDIIVGLGKFSAAGCDPLDLVASYSIDQHQWTNLVCDPYSVQYGPPGAIGGPPYEDMTTTTITATADPEGCCVLFHVVGCHVSDLEGALCETWTDSTKTTPIDSCTTASNGQCSVCGLQAGVYYEITLEGFILASGGIAPGAIDIEMEVDDADFVCTFFCSAPGDAKPVSK